MDVLKWTMLETVNHVHFLLNYLHRTLSEVYLSHQTYQSLSTEHSVFTEHRTAYTTIFTVYAKSVDQDMFKVVINVSFKL